MSRIVNLRGDDKEVLCTFIAHFENCFSDVQSFSTSGTTGKSKVIEHWRSSLYNNAEAFNETVGLSLDTRMYHCFPLNYMAGYLNTLLCPLIARGSVVIGPKFNPLNFWYIPLSQGCNTLWLTPTMAEALIRASRTKEEARSVGQQFVNIFCGTAPLRYDTRSRWLDLFGVPLQNSYGTTELLLVSVQNIEDARALKDNCGEILTGVQVKTVDDELQILSPYSMTENSVVECDQVWAPGGYIKTGDLGTVFDGRIVVTGRIKDIIIKGGENISPAIIEDCIRQLPHVTDVAVIGRPHNFWGESIVAFVESDCMPANVTSHCQEHLPQSHWPNEIVYVRELPRTSTGKVQKQELRSRTTSPSM